MCDGKYGQLGPFFLAIQVVIALELREGTLARALDKRDKGRYLMGVKRL
jgi:hypothetical protein